MAISDGRTDTQSQIVAYWAATFAAKKNEEWIYQDSKLNPIAISEPNLLFHHSNYIIQTNWPWNWTGSGTF